MKTDPMYVCMYICPQNSYPKSLSYWEYLLLQAGRGRFTHNFPIAKDFFLRAGNSDGWLRSTSAHKSCGGYATGASVVRASHLGHCTPTSVSQALITNNSMLCRSFPYSYREYQLIGAFGCVLLMLCYIYFYFLFFLIFFFILFFWLSILVRFLFSVGRC
jgi:hypothetical protein